MILSGPHNLMSRRGLLVGAALIATPFAVRSRADSIPMQSILPDRPYPDRTLLTTAPELYAQIVDDRLQVQLLDASDFANFRARHIVQAVHVWWQDTMELNVDYYGMVLRPDDDQSQSRRIRFLERIGVLSDRHTVVYDDTDGLRAARVVWFLTFLGLSASVLDGGLTQWKAISGPRNSDAPDIPESSNPMVSPRQGFYLNARQVVSAATEAPLQIVDLRVADERTHGPFRDRRIPGALDLPRDQVLTTDQVLLPGPELAALVAAAGIDLEQRIVLVAPTGVECSLAWLALKLLGAERVIICDGGWRQWIATPGLPLD